MADDLPSGRRMFELAREAIEIEKSANKACSPSYELFEFMVNKEADRAMRTMDPVEKRFFEALFGGVYVKPELREGWKTEHKIRRELRGELEGEQYEVDDPPGRQMRGEDCGIYDEHEPARLPEDEIIRHLLSPKDLRD
jgi:hypothetical protein